MLKTHHGGPWIYSQLVQSAAVRSISILSEDARSVAKFWSAVALMERFAGLLLFVLSLPVLIAAAIAIVTLSRRTPLIAHQRVGQGGMIIWVCKLRTMWSGPSGGALWPLVEYLRAPDIDCITPKKMNDPRITNRFAAICRRLSIDELPQFWHVARGEMALVGPRPLTRYELNAYYGTAAAIILKKKPGLSGLWQISGRSRLSYAQRRRLDLFMIRKWSVALYCRILIVTIPRVLIGKDAW